jgi:hypothetical protein
MLIGCGTSHPIYERSDTEQYGISVTIDGVVYQMYPQLKWDVSPDREIMGYAGTTETWMCWAKGDTEHNFVYLQDRGASMFYRPLYRTDRVIPEPSGDIVDTLYWSEYDFSGEENKHTSLYVTDKEIIELLFEILNNNERTTEYSFPIDYRIEISCYSVLVPGASYNLNIVLGRKKILCGTVEEGYTEISIELLESLAGYKLDMEKLSA